MGEPLTASVHVANTVYTLSYDPESEVQRGMWDDITSGRTYEPGTWATFRAILRPGDHVIDVGGHVGTFACLAAALVGDTGWVTAFEPDKQNFTGLVRNKALNHFAHLDVKPWAVSDSTKRVVFYRCADNDGGHALYDPGLQPANVATRKAPSKKMLNAVALDTVMGPDPIRLLKIDVEGAECAVLRGAQTIIATHRPAIIAEMNHLGLACVGETEESLRRLVRQHDYRAYAIQDASPFWVLLGDDQTINNRQIVNGRMLVTVYNMLFLPREWPDLTPPGDPNSTGSPTG